MSSPYKDFPLRQSRVDLDTYTPKLTEDLLQGLNDWRAVQDIVRLTFKALSDTVRSQGASLRELEQLLPCKASKAELNSALAVKANISDVSRTVTEVRGALESKLHMDEILTMVEDKVSRADLSHFLANKVSYEELRAALDSKADLRDVQSEVRAMRAAIEEIQHETCRRLNNVATLKDIERLDQALNSKANFTDMEVQLQEKANKQSVANALHRKANRSDIDEALALKADQVEMCRRLDEKADSHSLGPILRELDVKADRKDVTQTLHSEIARLKENSDAQLHAVQLNFDKVLSTIEYRQQELSNLFKEFEASVSNSLARKSEYTDIDKLMQGLEKKADSETISRLVNGVKTEHTRNLQDIQGQLRFEMKKSEEGSGSRIADSAKQTSFEVTRLREELKAAAEHQQGELNNAVKYLQEYALAVTTKEQKNVMSDISRLHRDLSEHKELTEKMHRDGNTITQDVRSWLEDMIHLKERDLRNTIEHKPSFEQVSHLVTDQLTRSFKPELTHLGSMCTQLQDEVSRRDPEHFVADLRGLHDRLDSILREVAQKANYNDLSAAVQRISRELEDHITEQAEINEMVCGETCVGRWIWKSGQVRVGNAVPWEVQNVNTCPDNFIWDPEGTSLVTVAPGLYEIHFGVFSQSKPEVHLLVNGETVMVDGTPLSKYWGRHSSGNVVGMTCLDFLALPARARLTLSYSGDPGAEGFLGIKKL